MMRRSLHRIAPTLLALGLLPGMAWAATASTAERDAHRAAVQALIERDYRLPASRQLAEFLKAGYPGAEWHGKVLSWFYADRFRLSAPDKAEAAKLEAEAKALGAELAAAAKADKLPPDLKDVVTGSGQVIRLVNDLLRHIGQDVAPDKLAISTMVAERKAALNATAASLVKATGANFAEALAKVAAHAKAEEDAWNLPENDPKYLEIIQKAVELRLDAVRPTYFAMKVLREVAERGADFALDPAPAQAFIKEFAVKNFKTLSEWDYNFGDYHPYLRALTVDLSAQAARYKKEVREASIEDLTTDYLRILDIDVAKDFRKAGPAVQEDIRTLQAKTWAGLFAWYRELGKDVAPKYYQAGLDLFQQFKERTKNDRAFRLDHPDRERAAEVARIYLQVGRLMQAKGDPAATGLFAMVGKERENPLAWHGSKWAAGGAGGSVTRAAWGELPIAEDPAQAVATAGALNRSANESGNAALQRSTMLAAAVALRNGVLGMTTTYSEGANDVAPELWFRYAETLKKLGMRWHAAVIAQAGLRDLAARMAEAKGNPWKGRDGKWTAPGRFVSPLAKNAVYYASDLLAAGRGGAITQLYDDSITLVNKVSPEDGGKALDRMQIVIRVTDKDYPGALAAIETYLKKYPEEFFDASSLRSTVRMGEYDAAKDDSSRERIAKSALTEAEQVAKKALDELKTTKDAGRAKVLRQATRDVQALQAFFALRLGQEQKVIEMLGPDYWKNPPSDEDKSVQMLGYLCRATKQWYEKQIKDDKKKADPATVTAAWPLVSQVYEIWKNQKQRLPSQDDKITSQGTLLAWVFQNMVNQTRAMAGPNAPAQLAEIGNTANRAFADLIEPNLHKGSSANTLLGVGNVLWLLDEHKRAARLFELWRANIAAEPDIAMLRDDPKAMLDPLDGPLNGRPELRAAWTELKDLLIDQPDLAKRILEGDLPEDRWGEKKRDYGKAASALQALRENLKKIRISMGADFQKADEGLAKLEGLVAQLAREIDVLAKLALAYREQGNKAKANAIYDKLIAYDPTNPDFLAATVELTIDQIKKGEAITKEVAEATQIKAARVRDAAQNGSPTYWTAVIQVLELAVYLKDIGLVDRRLKFDATNQSTPADDLQLLPRNPRDDKRVRRARNALATELCRRYLEIFKQPGITAKPGFAIESIDIDGIATAVFVPVGGPKFVPVRRELEDGTVLFFLWEEGKEPPPEPTDDAAPPAVPEAAPAPATQPEAKP